MCGKNSDYKAMLAHQKKLNFFKYNFVLLLLFIAAFSALGLSCYAVHKVNILSDDLNLLRTVLNSNRIKTVGETFNRLNGHQNWGDETNNSEDEAPILGKIVQEHTLPERTKRSVISEKGNHVETESYTDKEESSTLNEGIEETTTTYTTEKINSYLNIRLDLLHHIKKKAVAFEDETESFTPQYHQVQPNTYRHRHRGRHNNQLEIVDEFSPQAGRLKSLKAVHFNGDTSKYVYGHHTNFNGNGHLRHPKKTFVDWKKSDWVEAIGTDVDFPMNDGTVTIKDAGLYFVYAQIYYLDEHDMNGYRVYKNSEILLQCTTTSHSVERMMRGNTCYTGSVSYLDVNDAISLSDISDGRYSLFEPGKSFFGLIKLGDAKNR